MQTILRWHIWKVIDLMTKDGGKLPVYWITQNACVCHIATHAISYDIYPFMQIHIVISYHTNTEHIPFQLLKHLRKFVLWNWTYHAARHMKRNAYAFTLNASAWSMHKIGAAGINLCALWIMMELNVYTPHTYILLKIKYVKKISFFCLCLQTGSPEWNASKEHFLCEM